MSKSRRKIIEMAKIKAYMGFVWGLEAESKAGLIVEKLSNGEAIQSSLEMH